jgi:hypothetical protein
MAQLIHLHCRHCGEQLTNRSTPYCPPCNLYLCYRAMPILLGMLMTGHLQLQPAYVVDKSTWPQSKRGYEDKSVLIWE